MILWYYLKKQKKIAESWKNVQLIETKGLGHKLHDDELYQKINKFLFEHE